MLKKQGQKTLIKASRKNNRWRRKSVLGWLSRPGSRHGPASMPGRPAKPAQPARSTASERAREQRRASLPRGGLGREVGWARGGLGRAGSGPAGARRDGLSARCWANRPGDRPGPGRLSARPPSQPAWQPAWAGLDAVQAPEPTGLPAGMGRAGCWLGKKNFKPSYLFHKNSKRHETNFVGKKTTSVIQLCWKENDECWKY